MPRWPPLTNKFRGLVFKLASPKSTFLVFENSQVVCVGARGQYHALHGARRLVRLLRTVESRVIRRVKEFAIKNVVTHGHALGPVSLPKLFSKNKKFANMSRNFFQLLSWAWEIQRLLIYNYWNKKYVGCCVDKQFCTWLDKSKFDIVPIQYNTYLYIMVMLLH